MATQIHATPLNMIVPPAGMRADAASRRVLDVARDMLRTQDYRSFRLEGVAMIAGMSRRAIHALFADREALYRASRSELLRDFAHLLPQDSPPELSLGDALQRYCAQVTRAFATLGHRELLASAQRDALQQPWLAALYEDAVNAPLTRLLADILDRASSSGVQHIARDRHAQRGVALIRAAVGEPDMPPALSAHEFAHIFESRLRGGAIGDQPGGAARDTASDVAEPVEPARRPMIRRGAVTITFDPLEVCWNQVRVALSPLEGQLLACVARRGRSSWAQIDDALGGRAGRTASRDVLIFRLRRKFAAIGAVEPIETIRGWGLKFRTECDAAGSRTVWIGARERDEAGAATTS